MIEPPATSRRGEWLELWERRELPFFRVLPYVLLALCLPFDAGEHHGLSAGFRLDLGLAAACAVLMRAIDRRDRRSSWLDRQDSLPRPVAALAFAALTACSAALVISDPLWGFYTWTGYFWAWRLLEGSWRFAGVTLVAAIAATSQTGSGPYHGVDAVGGLIAVYLVNAGIASAMTWFGSVGNEQQQRRTLEVSALTEANAKLEESQRHNADLHERLLTQARDAGVSDERRRMAREIHDTLAQGLTGIITQLQAAQQAGAGMHAGAHHLQSAVELARESLSEARRSLLALAPEALADARLPEAVHDVAQRWSQMYDVPVTFKTTGTARVMRPEVEVALLRTAQEALANVAKHARAGRVGLTLSYMEDLVTLDVRDDGVGFVTVNGTGPRRPHDAHGGFGLSAMRQRLESVGGALEIESEPHAGTAISATIPAASAADQR